MKRQIDIYHLAGIQYIGTGGISVDCLRAIIRLLHFGDEINSAKLLTSLQTQGIPETLGTHCFLLVV